MCVAAIPVGVSLAMTAAATAATVYGAVQSSNAQKAASDYQSQVAANNSKIASYNASQAVATGNTEVQAAQAQAAQRQGTIRAVMGAGGLDLDSGSPLRNQIGVAQVDKTNQQTITSNAARSAWNYTNQGADYSATSSLEQMQGQQAQTAGMMKGFSSLLSGAGSFADSYNKYYPTATS